MMASSISGLRTQESVKFNAYFARIQVETAKMNAVFFADAGDGNDFETLDWEGENMMGWLIPIERVAEFEPLWAQSTFDDSWFAFFGWAVWYSNGNSIGIRFEL